MSYKNAARFKEVVRRRMEFSNPSHSRTSLFMGCGMQTGSYGSYVFDHNSRKFLDLFDAYGNQSFGYAHSEILEAIQKQLDLKHTNNCKVFFDERASELALRLAELTNFQLPYSFLTNGGAEAVEAAIKLARGVTRRPKFITAQNSYHGKTFAALSAAVRPEYIEMYKPMMPDFVSVPFGQIDAMEAAIDGQTAAVLLEPIQCEGGINVPSKSYLKQVKLLCERNGSLLILDETQTGFGRTGKFFAFEHYDVVPDILTIGKSFGGGMLPVAAMLARKDCWFPLTALPLSFGSSLGGCPLSSAVGLKTIEIATRAQFLATVQDHGELVTGRLNDLMNRHPKLIRTVRGLGLLFGIELFEPGVAGLILWLLYKRGVMTAFCLFNPFVIRVQPPLIIERQEIELGLSALDAAFAEAETYLACLGCDQRYEPVVVREFEVPLSVEELFQFLSEYENLHSLSPFIRTSSKSASSLYHCEADLEGIPLEWEETIEIDSVQKCVVQRVTGGDWKLFDRTWVVSHADSKKDFSKLTLIIKWDAGSAEFEKILALRLRYSLEHELEERLEAKANWVQAAGNLSGNLI